MRTAEKVAKSLGLAILAAFAGLLLLVSCPVEPIHFVPIVDSKTELKRVATQTLISIRDNSPELATNWAAYCRTLRDFPPQFRPSFYSAESSISAFKSLRDQRPSCALWNWDAFEDTLAEIRDF